MIDSMDSVLAEDIPRLMQQFPQERESGSAHNPFESSNMVPFLSGTVNDNPITEDDRSKAREIFNSLGPVEGKIGGKAASAVLMQSKLPRDILSKIWVLSDRDKDGLLTEDEFAISLYLVKQSMDGKPIPHTLPLGLQLKQELFPTNNPGSLPQSHSQVFTPTVTLQQCQSRTYQASQET